MLVFFSWSHSKLKLARKCLIIRNCSGGCGMVRAQQYSAAALTLGSLHERGLLIHERLPSSAAEAR